MLRTKHITGIVLSGGKSSRMGTDKGFVLWQEKPFVQCSIDALKPMVDEIIIVSDHSEYDVLGYKRVQDRIPEAGPLSGLYSGLLKSETHLNFVLSCDIPLISSEILEELLTAYDKGTKAVICKTSHNVMPLVALYTKDCLEVCRKFLDKDERRMMRLLEELDGVKYVTLNEQQVKQVRNINTTKDLNEINNEG